MLSWLLKATFDLFLTVQSLIMKSYSEIKTGYTGLVITNLTFQD